MDNKQIKKACCRSCKYRRRLNQLETVCNYIVITGRARQVVSKIPMKDIMNGRKCELYQRGNEITEVPRIITTRM